MGARTNFELKDSKGSVWLYSHWGGDSKMTDLAAALEKAEPRWDDITYGLRIVVSQLIGNDWNSETGFGLSSYEAGEEGYEPICVDFANKTINYEGVVYSYREFLNSYGSVETLANHLTNAQSPVIIDIHPKKETPMDYSEDYYLGYEDAREMVLLVIQEMQSDFDTPTLEELRQRIV